jgi:outer membrane receptor for ferrienterochelin and colicins
MDVTKQKTTLKQDNCLPEIYRTWAISYRVNKLFLDIDYTGNLYGPMRCYLLGA